MRVSLFPQGMLKSLGDAIRLLAGDPQKRRILGQNGRRFIETHFDRTVVAEKLNTLIEQMVGNANQIFDITLAFKFQSLFTTEYS